MEHLLAALTDPLHHPFMQRALVVAVMVSSMCALFSCFLVLKGWSLMGDAVSHAILPGLALAVMTGLPLSLGALAAGLTCAFGANFLARRCPLKPDAVMGIVFSGMFALGLVLLPRLDTDLHLMHVLFGNLLGVRPEEMLEILIASACALGLLLLCGRDLLLLCFDPVQAQAAGLPRARLEFLLLLCLALVIVAALKAAGIILVVAMLIAPGATAFLLARSFGSMIGWALATAVLSALMALYVSFYADVATAPLLVCTQALFFLMALGVQGRRERRAA